jgi:uncharacterized protein DUF4253
VVSVVSAGTTFNDVRIPFPHVCVTGVAARPTFEVLRREHPTATPIIISGNHDSLRLLFDGRPAPPPEELIELSLRRDGRSAQLAYEEDLYDRRRRRLKELDAPEILIQDWQPPETVNLADIMRQKWPEEVLRPTDLSCTFSSDKVLIVLIPTVRPWEAAAYLGFGGWNSCPAPWVHVAYAREWSARFGARLLAVTHDTLEFEVARPITSREEAAAMAAVHAYYCSDTVSLSMALHAACLLGAPVWQFWWD